MALSTRGTRYPDHRNMLIYEAASYTVWPHVLNWRLRVVARKPPD